MPETHDTASDQQDILKQLRSLKLGLQISCLLISLYLSFRLYFTVASLGPARETYSHLSVDELPALAAILYRFAYLGHLFLLLSFAFLIVISIFSMRCKNFLFLTIFSCSLCFHLLLLTWIEWSIKVPTIRIIQNLTS